MKYRNLFLLAVFALLLHACYDPGTVQVQNNINRAKVIDVKWGDHYIAGELLPGESSSKVSIERRKEKLPSSNRVTFKLSANNKVVFLESQDEYELDEDEDLLIVLDDDTPVRNPNE